MSMHSIVQQKQKTGVMPPKFRGGHSLKRYASELPFTEKQNIISSTHTNNHGSGR